jgi:hypothetical protein
MDRLHAEPAAAHSSPRVSRRQKLKDDLYVIALAKVVGGGNIAVYVSDEGVILVDDMFDRDYTAVMEKVRSITDKPVKYVLNSGLRYGSRMELYRRGGIAGIKGGVARYLRDHDSRRRHSYRATLVRRAAAYAGRTRNAASRARFTKHPHLRRTCRGQVIVAKARARFLNRKNALKAEMVEWMLVWLGDPAMFSAWAALRRERIR